MRLVKIKPLWLKGLDDQAQKELREDFISCPLTRERLTSILEDKIDNSLRQMRDAASGGIPNLSEYYADELATQKTLEYVISLIKEK